MSQSGKARFLSGISGLRIELLGSALSMPVDEHAVELARQILNAACGSLHPAEAIDLEAAVVRSLTLLTMGHTGEFRDNEQPPAHIKAWLRSAEPRQVRGLLMVALRRWHELSGKEES